MLCPFLFESANGLPSRRKGKTGPPTAPHPFSTSLLISKSKGAEGERTCAYQEVKYKQVGLVQQVTLPYADVPVSAHLCTKDRLVRLGDSAHELNTLEFFIAQSTDEW